MLGEGLDFLDSVFPKEDIILRDKPGGEFVGSQMIGEADLGKCLAKDKLRKLL